jgi:hypothetical protein
MVFICGDGYAQGTADEKSITAVSTTLVNNQLSPELVKVEYAGGYSNGLLKSGDGKLENKFQQSNFTISAFPVTLINKRQAKLYLGVGYVEQRFSGFTNETYASLFSERIKSVYFGTALSVRFNKRFFWLSYVQPGFNGTEPLENLDKTFNAVIVSKADYKWQRNLNVGLGIAYFTNMGNPLILPAVSFAYSQPGFVLNIDFPVKTEIEAILARGKIRPVAGVSYHGGNYYLNHYNRYLYDFGALGYLGIRVKLLDFLYCYAAYQTGVYDQYKSGERHSLAEIGTYSGQNQFVVSLNVQIARFIPRLQH